MRGKEGNHVKRTSKMLTVLLVLSMLVTLFGGCGRGAAPDGEGGGKEQEAGQQAENGREEENTQSPDNVAMGRYMETVLDLSEYVSYNNSFYLLDDGKMIITDKYRNFIASEDDGETWKPYVSSWRTELMENENYVMDYAIGKDGTAAVIYDVSNEESEEENRDLKLKLAVYKPDGTEIPVEIPLTEDERYLRGVWIADNGRIFASSQGNAIYEVKEDGSSEKFLTINESYPSLIQFVGNKMIIDGYDYDSLLIYDMEKEEYVEDPVLDDFVHENYPSRDFNGGSWYDLFFFQGEEDVLYLAGKKGLHRHVLGGSAMEQVIDGSLCTLNNPAYGLQGMTALENNEFMALFTDGRLVRYTYDPAVPTVPSERIKAYSLRESTTLRRAINLYQGAHPEVYVEYEIGMEENDSVTSEDALKKLNTQIMAGEGPDLLILDEMPIDSYVEKGVLLDLADYLDGLAGEQELFSNIVDSFRKDGRIFTVPCEFQLPVVLGEEKYTSQMSDLEGIAAAIEALRRDNPGEDILDVCSELGIMRTLSTVCAPSWENGDGGINKEAVSEFLQNAKRVYDAQMDGLPESEVEEYRMKNEEWAGYYNVSWENSSYFTNGLDEIGYIEGSKKLDFGTVGYSYSYAMVTSLERREDTAGSILDFWNGQGGKVFVAKTLAGISASSAHTSQTMELLGVLLGVETVAGNFPVNKAAFEETLIPDPQYYVSDDVPYSSITSTSGDGIIVDLDIYWMNEEQNERLRGWVTSVDTPYVSNGMLEETVYEKGAAYISGDQSLEDTLSEIEKKMAIYMAE